MIITVDNNLTTSSVTPYSQVVIAVAGPVGPSGNIGPIGPAGTGLTDFVVFTTGDQLVSGQKVFVTGLHVSGNGVNFDTPVNPPWQEGRVFYDQDEHALSYYNDSEQVTVNIGQETLIRVVNQIGTDILDGQAVYISGAQGNRPRAWLALASREVSENVIGIATQNISNNSNGYVTTQGIVRGLNMSAFTEGDSIYLSPIVSGGFVAAPPAAPNIVVKIGTVLNNSASIGSIYVDPEVVTSHINQLHDVYINTGTLQNGDYLTYNATGAYWTNTAPASGYNVLNLSGNYAILSTDEVIVFNSATGVTGTLPTPSKLRIDVKNLNVGPVLLTGVGALIDGGVTATLYQYDSVTLQGNPPNWIVL